MDQSFFLLSSIICLYFLLYFSIYSLLYSSESSVYLNSPCAVVLIGDRPFSFLSLLYYCNLKAAYSYDPKYIFKIKIHETPTVTAKIYGDKFEILILESSEETNVFFFYIKLIFVKKLLLG